MSVCFYMFVSQVLFIILFVVFDYVFFIYVNVVLRVKTQWKKLKKHFLRATK